MSVNSHRDNFISCLIATAQQGFSEDVDPFLGLCHETWGEEALLAAVKDVPHGLLHRTRLMYAAQAGDIERVAALSDVGANPSLQNSMGRSALHLAAAKGQVASINSLVKGVEKIYKNPYMHIKSDRPRRPVPSVKNFLEQKTSTGATALLFASEGGHLKAVQRLIELGAAVDAARNDGATPLYLASKNGHLGVVQELLTRGAAVDAAINDRYTPLFVASQNGHLEVVRELLAKGAKVDAKRDDGMSPLCIAKLLKKKEIVKLLEKTHNNKGVQSSCSVVGARRRTHRNKKRRTRRTKKMQL